VAVGNLSWQTLAQTYFRAGPLPKTMRLGSEYRGNVNPGSSYAECPKSARTCRDVCLDFLKSRGVGPGSSSDMRPEPPKDMKCLHVEDSECWDVPKMRCWNPDGGVFVWDGTEEWRLIFHYTANRKSSTPGSYFTSNLPWIQLRSPLRKIDFFIFGWGVNRPIHSICGELTSSIQYSDRNFPNQIRAVPPDHSIVLAGHSEGAGWAVCANLWIKKRNIPFTVRVLGTGSLVADDIFNDEYFQYSKEEENLFMLTADLVKLHGGTELVADLFPIKMTKEGITLPQFGYACAFERSGSQTAEDQRGLLAIHRPRCLDPQPNISLDDSLKLVNQHELMNAGTLVTIHALKTYSDCFQACLPNFEASGFDFTPNVPRWRLPSATLTRPFAARAKSMAGNLNELTGDTEKLRLDDESGPRT